MFSLFELETLCGDEKKLRKLPERYGVLKDVPTCEDLFVGLLKTFLRARGGVLTDHLESNVKEFQWRRNLPDDADPFLSLLSCIRDGYFQ